MWMFIGLLSFLGLFVFLIMALVAFFKKNGKIKRWLFTALGCFVLLIVAIIADSSKPSTTATNTTSTQVTKAEKQKSDEQAKKTEEAQKKLQAEVDAKKKADEEAAAKKAAEETPKQKMLKSIKSLIDSKQAFDTGNYIQGDIPAGEYAFISFEGSGKYYDENDSANNILDNENFDSFGYVYVHAAGNLQTQGLLVNTAAFPQLGVTGAKQIYETLNDVQNYKGAGYYKVGVDLPAGKYIIESQGEGYVAAMTGPVGKSDIINNENFNGRYSVSVTNGQYLTVSRGTITQ